MAEATTPIATAGAGAAQRFDVGATATPPKPSRDAVLATIVRLLREKGAPAAALLQSKIKAGQGLTVKGCLVETSLLQEALTQVNKGPATGQGKGPATPSAATGQGNSAVPGRPATVGTAAPAPAASTGTTAPAGARFVAEPPSAAALAQKALQECETAEPFVRKVKNAGQTQVAILARPNTSANATGGHIAPGEVFDVIARCSRVQDGRTYLRLRRSEGWVSTRSPKHFWTVVLTSAENGASVEPVGSATTTFQSRASQVLSRVDAEGRQLGSQGEVLQSPSLKEPKAFRIAGGRGQSILSHPSVTGSVGVTLQAWDEFQADAICIVAAEGRTYLRLQDGRGWICERSRGDFSRYAVEPLGFSVPHDDHEQRMRAASRRLVGLSGSRNISMESRLGRAKTGVIERTGPDYDVESIKAAAVQAVQAAKPPPRSTPLKDEAVVLRSDAELWPKLLGAPKPIKGEMRAALRRLSRLYFRKVKECEEDLKEVEERIEGFARACDGKKVMQSHADVLRKEIAKVEQEWKVAIEKDIAGVAAVPAPTPRSAAGSGSTVAPVQVLGEAWHCAVVRTVQDDGEGGKCTVQHFGPLRADAAAASEDLQQLSEAVSKRAASGVKDESPPAKKRRGAAGAMAKESTAATESPVSKDAD